MRKRNSSQVSWSSRGLSCIQRSTMRETAFWQIMSCPFPAAVMLPDASSALLPPPAGSEHTPFKRKFLLLLILIVPQVQECVCVCVRQFLFVHLCGCIMQTCVCVPCLMIHYCPQVFKRRHYCITFNLKIHKWNATNESSRAGERLWLYSAEHLPPSAPFCSPRPRPTPIPVPCNEKPLIMTIGLVFLRSMCPSVPPPLLSLSSEIRALCAYVWTEGIVCVCVFTICESLMMLLLSKLWGRFITPISVLWWL